MTGLTSEQHLRNLTFVLNGVLQYCERTVRALEENDPSQARCEVNYIRDSVEAALNEMKQE